ncbi:hypothetical protein F52700_8360 [Fusarium sp. NRRL 52700]|nr:hypothetical protein F52700_8360 [Fusarium sp. NRRL 52700]
MGDFQWYNDAAGITPPSQDRDSEADPGFLLPGANSRQTQYNFAVHVPEVMPPYPMTFGYNPIPTQPGSLIMPASAFGLGVSITQPDNRQGGFAGFPSSSNTSLVQLPATYMNPTNPAMFQQNGIGISVSPYPIDTDLVMADTGIMSQCPSTPVIQPHENMSCAIAVAKSRVQSKKKSAEQEGPKNRDEKWEPWRETIKYLKLEQGHTFPEVAFEMSSIHGFKFACKVDAQRYLSDNRLLQVPSVSSEPYVFQYKILHAIDSLVKMLFDQKGRYKWSSSRTTLTLSNQFLEDSATKSLAAWQSLYDKCRGIEALHEGHVMKGTLSRLKLLFDRVLSQVKATEFTCDPHMLLYIWKVCDALMSVILDGKIWVKKYILVSVFLQSLRLRLRSLGFKGSDHLMVLVDSLFSVLNSTPLDLKKSLGLGCWKFLEILGSQIGNDHLVVLNLGMYCNRTWGNIWGLVDVEELQARYKPYLPLRNGGHRPPIAITAPEHNSASMSDEQLERIEMLHMSGLALSDVLSTLKAKRSNDRTRAHQITLLLSLIDSVCLELVDLAQHPCRQEATQGRLKYTTVARALAFALEQLAYDLHEKATTEELDVRKRKRIRKHRNQAKKRARLGQLRESDSEAAVRFSTNPGDITNIYRFMDEAIEILRRGDKDCRLRAAQLSRKLMSWMKTYSQGEIQANRRGRSKGQHYKNERDRAREILASIFPGEKIESKKQERAQFHQSVVKNVNMEEAKAVQVVIRPRRDREKKTEKAPAPLPLKERKSRDCGEVFGSRNRLFEEHVNVVGACSPRQEDVQDEPRIQHADPYMGWPHEGECRRPQPELKFHYKQAQETLKVFAWHPLLVPLILMEQRIEGTAENLTLMRDSVYSVEKRTGTHKNYRNDKNHQELNHYAYGDRVWERRHEQDDDFEAAPGKITSIASECAMIEAKFEVNENLLDWLQGLNNSLDKLNTDGGSWERATSSIRMKISAFKTWSSNDRARSIYLAKRAEAQMQAASNRKSQKRALNLKKTEAALRDSSDMRAIAWVTFVFLPATFVAIMLAIGLLSFRNELAELTSAKFSFVHDYELASLS